MEKSKEEPSKKEEDDKDEERSGKIGTVKKRVTADAQAKVNRKWNTGNHLVELGILGPWVGIKEEPLTPLLDIKVKSLPTPCLHYPHSSMSSSHFRSIDPNNFVWSP